MHTHTHHTKQLKTFSQHASQNLSIKLKTNVHLLTVYHNSKHSQNCETVFQVHSIFTVLRHDKPSTTNHSCQPACNMEMNLPSLDFKPSSRFQGKNGKDRKAWSQFMESIHNTSETLFFKRQQRFTSKQAVMEFSKFNGTSFFWTGSCGGTAIQCNCAQRTVISRHETSTRSQRFPGIWHMSGNMRDIPESLCWNTPKAHSLITVD